MPDAPTAQHSWELTQVTPSRTSSIARTERAEQRLRHPAGGRTPAGHGRRVADAQVGVIALVIVGDGHRWEAEILSIGVLRHSVAPAGDAVASAIALAASSPASLASSSHAWRAATGSSPGSAAWSGGWSPEISAGVAATGPDYGGPSGAATRPCRDTQRA